MNKELAEQKFRSFIDSITPESQVMIIHDTDMDGHSAGVLAKKGLEQLGKTVAVSFPKEHGGREVTENLLNQIKEHSITHIVCVDLALENYTGAQQLEGLKVLVLDHHPTVEPYVQSFTIIKPHDIQDRVEDFKYCAAQLTYTMFSTLTDMSSYDWLAATGIISDMTFSSHKEFLQAFAKKYNMQYYEEGYDMDIAELVKQGGYGSAFGSDNADEIIFNALDTSSNYKEAIAKMHEFDPVKEEQDKLLSEFAEKKETHGNIHFYQIESKYHLASPVSSILSRHYVNENEILVTLKDKKDGQTSSSARRQDCKMHMGDMMREVTADFENSNGGGHPPAAGAKFPTKNKEEFKANIIAWVKTHG